MTSTALYAHLDLLSSVRLLGWCKSDQGTAQNLELHIKVGDKTIRSRPNTNRKDVKLAHGGDIQCGFDLRLPNFDAAKLKDAEIVLRNTKTGAQVPVEFSNALQKQHASPSSYQSFSPGKGSSKSEQKLAAISLPNLKGKRFLDIGCNAGFFCKHAIAQGAKRVVGIEAQKKFADQARTNAPGAEILNQRWDRLPDEKFDVIIMLSALHYERNPKQFLQRIRKMLAPDGVFVLEGGVARSEFTIWKTVHRGVGAVKYPSTSLLQDHLFEGFAYRYIGPSVNQPGDPLPRHVYHASPKCPIWTVVRGQGRAGKTTVAASMGRGGMPNIRLDRMMTDQWLQKIPTGDDLFDDYITQYQPRNVGSWVDGIEDPNLAQSVARYLVETVPTECDTVIEGYIMTNDLIFAAFTKLAAAKGVRVWATDRVV